MKTKKEKIKEQTKKEISSIKFIVLFSIILIISSMLLLTGFNYLMNKFLNDLFLENVIVYSIIYNSIWIILSVIELLIVFKITKKFKLNEKQNLLKNIILILEYIILIILNIQNICELITYNIEYNCLFILIHICIIWYINVYYFEKNLECERLKIDLLSFIISTVLFMILIYVIEFINFENTSIKCTRNNNDIVSIRVNKDSVISIIKNDEFVDEKELINYNMSIINELINVDKSKKEKEIINEYLDIISKFEKETYSSTCETK